MSYNELYEHKRSDTVKWVLTLIAFIVVGIMLAGIICGWFEKDDAEEEQAGVPAYSFIVGNSEGNRVSLTSVRNSTVTGESVTITATVEPDNEAENTGVDWTATWKNAESVWASGKSVSDYVTLTPGGEDYAASKSVTLENLQPFGEQIIIKATARDDPGDHGNVYGGLCPEAGQFLALVRGSFLQFGRGYGRHFGDQCQCRDSSGRSSGCTVYKKRSVFAFAGVYSDL